MDAGNKSMFRCFRSLLPVPSSSKATMRWRCPASQMTFSPMQSKGTRTDFAGFYSFSGFNFTPASLDLMLQVGVGRIMFSTDHPYASMTVARAFFDKLPVGSADQARVALET